MHFTRLLRTRRVAVFLLIAVIALTVISIGEIFKVYTIRPDGVRLRRRDGATITFSLPWKSPVTAPIASTKSKAVSPIFSDLLNGVTNVADALLKGGVDITNNVVGEGSDVVSMALKGEDTPALISSILNEVNRVVSQATAVVGEVVDAATSIVGAVLSEAVSASNVGVLTSLMPSNKTGVAAMTTSRVILSSKSSRPGNSTALNITSGPTILLTSSAALPLMTPSCPIMTPVSCPSPQTVTCTETWHSTHYASTATLFSFMSLMTVTCTETISICPSSPHLAPNNSTLPSSRPGLIECANGVLVKRTEDCPTTVIEKPTIVAPCAGCSPHQSHPCPGSGYACSECPDGWFCPPAQTSAQSCLCGMGWACGACNGGWYCPPSTTGDIGSLASHYSISSSTQLEVTSNMGSAVNPPSNTMMMPTIADFTMSSQLLAKAMSQTATTTGMVMCADGTVVMSADLCLNGVSSSMTALLASRTSPASVMSQATGVPGSAAQISMSILESVGAGVTGVLGNVNGLSETLIATVLAEVNSAISAAKGSLGTAIPKPTNLGVVVSNAAGGLSSVAPGNVINLANNVGENLPKAAATLNNLAGNVLPGGIKAIASKESNVLGGLATTINGSPTILTIVATDINGVPTVVPVLDMMVNGALTAMPIINNPAGLFGRGKEPGLEKLRRSIDGDQLCKEHPESEVCKKGSVPGIR